MEELPGIKRMHAFVMVVGLVPQVVEAGEDGDKDEGDVGQLQPGKGKIHPGAGNGNP
jgi:hypothetical protein